MARLRSELDNVVKRCKDEVSDKARAHELECAKVESETKSRAEALHRRATDELMAEARRDHENIVTSLRAELDAERSRNSKTSARSDFVCPECPKKHAEILRMGDELTMKGIAINRLEKHGEELRKENNKLKQELQNLSATIEGHEGKVRLAEGKQAQAEEFLRHEHQSGVKLNAQIEKKRTMKRWTLRTGSDNLSASAKMQERRPNARIGN